MTYTPTSPYMEDLSITQAVSVQTINFSTRSISLIFFGYHGFLKFGDGETSVLGNESEGAFIFYDNHQTTSYEA